MFLQLAAYENTGKYCNRYPRLPASRFASPVRYAHFQREVELYGCNFHWNVNNEGKHSPITRSRKQHMNNIEIYSRHPQITSVVQATFIHATATSSNNNREQTQKVEKRHRPIYHITASDGLPAPCKVPSHLPSMALQSQGFNIPYSWHK